MEGVGDWKKGKLRVYLYEGNGNRDGEKGGEDVERIWDEGQKVDEVLQVISHWLMRNDL